MDLPIDQETGLPYIVINGEVRKLGTFPRSPANPQSFRSATGVIPDIPKSEFRNFNRRSFWKWILNQKSHGSCTGFATSRALMSSRAYRGLTPFVLSGSYVYSWINGGMDRGSIIHEAMDVVLNKGVALDSECPWDMIYTRQIPASAHATAKRRFRAEDCVVAQNYHQICCGIMVGWFPVFAVMVGGNYNNLDQNGIIGFDRGPGNHAVTADDLTKVAGDWCLDHPGSWGTSWGDQGRGYFTEKHIDSVGYQDIYLIKAAQEDPDDPDPVPTPATTQKC